MKMRGHTLIWAKDGPWIPSWLRWEKDPHVIESFMKTYIQTVMRHVTYPYVWDVVNEALTNTGEIRKDHVFSKVPDFICKSLKWAHEANPNAKLYINDYCVLSATGWSKKKSDGLYNLVKDLKNRGCPIHGVGFQTHVTTNYFYDGLDHGAVGIHENIQRYAAIGVETQMTEVDVACDKHNNSCNWDSAARQLQGKVFSHLLALCISEPNCKAFVTWGFTDLISW
jgi:endo-1,4-beta-xylanase